MSSFNCNECGTAIIDTDKGCVTACEHWPMDGLRITTDVSNQPLIMDGLALQYPTPKQIDHDIIEQLSLHQQKIVALEMERVFHKTCIKNLVERLSMLEGKLNMLEVKHAAIEQQFLEILSHGCCIPIYSKHQGPVEGNG